MTGDKTRDRILAALWEGIRSLDVESVRNFPAARRAIDSGANPVDLVHAMSAAAYESAFNALYTLTGEGILTEVANSGALDMLHEDLLSADPTGLEGSDLFA